MSIKNEMKNSISICFLLLSISLNAQLYLIGKKYTAHTGTSCKLYNDGGCDIYYYKDLEFEKDSVIVTNRINFLYVRNGSETKNKSIEKKKYKWSIRKNIIFIKNYNDFDKLRLINKIIIGHIISSDNESRKIIFEPQIN
jgi:hypothetical protein